MNTSNNHQDTLFHSLHKAGTPLTLANAWDVASAVIAEAAGARAIATTSAGMAWSLGYADGDTLSRARAVGIVAGIAAAVSVPVTADIEGGYGDSPQDVAETVREVLEAGAAGINIEDGNRTPEDFAARIAAARRAADKASVNLFINARTDVFLAGSGTAEWQLAEVLGRAKRYVDAGADGIFVPGVDAAEPIAALTAGICVPVNIMLGPGGLSVGELGGLGVARVSLGSGVAQAAYAVVHRAARELAATGTCETLAGALDYGSLNGMFLPVPAR